MLSSSGDSKTSVINLSWPSICETFPANKPIPFLGVCFIPFVILIKLSKASWTFFLVEVDLIFDAVDFSDSSCFVIKLMSYPLGT